MTSPRILFVHGLESRALGSKTILLREQGFDVRAHDMDMGVWQVFRKNSVVRMALRLPEVQAALGGSLAAFGRFRSTRSRVISLASLATWGFMRKNVIMAEALSKSFAACVEIQKFAIAQEQPDIVIGSSWGGAVVVELMRQGVWSGRTVLLAPAVQRVCQRTGQGDSREIARELRGKRVIIFHDPSDDVVPFVDSEVLANEGQFELRAVDAGGHRLLGICEDGRLANALHAFWADPGA